MSLTSIAPVIWNQIAETQKLKTAWARKAFVLDGQAMAELEDREWRVLKGSWDTQVASAAISMKPLLLECVAIANYVEEHPQWFSALLEIASIDEAVYVASMDYSLTEHQQAELKDLLEMMISECAAEAKGNEAGAGSQEWSPVPGALVTVLLDLNGKRRQTAMVVDISSTNFVLVELMGAGRQKERPQLRFFPRERVLRRQADMLSIGSDALFQRRGG